MFAAALLVVLAAAHPVVLANAIAALRTLVAAIFRLADLVIPGTRSEWTR